MAVKSNLVDYHKSIAAELQSVQHRIRDLIGQSHWLTDGEHKEAVLRNVLRSHLPETVRIGSGFVFFGRGGNSNQVDILITNKSKPTLFKEEDLTIVTPDAVRAVIEVKTKISSSDLLTILGKLADNVERIRENQASFQSCWAGLFAYESSLFSDEQLLETLWRVSNNRENRRIDCVTLGPDKFARFVREDGNDDAFIRTGWVAYYLKNLAQAYFLSHTVWNISKDNMSTGDAWAAWFPIKDSAKHHGTWNINFQDGKLNRLYREQHEEESPGFAATVTAR